MKVGTLFSGIGAPEFALKESKISHSIEFACDNDIFVKETYLQNHKCKYFYNNINDITNLPSVDLLVFGFPCQPFSFAGKRLGLKDERGKLILKALQIINKNKPKAFIAENVEGLITRDKGKTLRLLLSKIRRMGYKVKHSIINALDYGIPQNRKRLWIVGTLNKDFEFSKHKITHSPLSSFLDKKVDNKYYATKSFLTKQKVIQRIKNYKKDYINCITQTICRNGSSSEYISYVAAVHNAVGQTRKPTVDECCRLFGFPENFTFPESVSITRQYAMLANSMVVPVIKTIIEKLYE